MTRSQISFLLMTLATLAILYIMQAEQFVVDESLHHGQILSLMNGDNSRSPHITTFLVFHTLYALTGQLFGLVSVLDFRLLSFVLTGLMILVLIRFSRDENGAFNWLLASQLFFLPIALPYYPLIYTDILALTLLYTAYHQFNLKRHGLTVLFAAMAVLIRQPSLVWLGLFLSVCFFQNLDLNGYKITRRQFYQALISSWVYLVGIVGFLLYFLLSGGVSKGAQEYHQVSINVTNVYFMVLVFWLVFWPLLLSRYQQVLSVLRQNKWIILLTVIGLPIYMATYSVSNYFNSPALNVFLRNWLLNQINESLWLQLIAYLISVYTVLAMSTVKLKSPVWNWLYVFLPLSVIAMPLIEQRYYIVGMAFWQLSRTFVAVNTERIQLLWMVVFSLFLYIGMSRAWFYL